MLLRTYLGKILFLFSAIVGIPALVGEARHINFQARLDKCVVECRRVRLQNPGRGVPSLPPCSDICLNRTKAGGLGVRGINSSSLVDQQLPDLESLQQRTRKETPNVSDCPLSSGHLDWTPSSVNVTFHQYPNSSNWYINITWTPLNDSSANWTNIFVRLTIEVHLSSSRSGPFLCIVLPKNQTFLIVDNSSNGWSYPDAVLLHVTALPYSNKGGDMYFHAPPESSNTTAKTTASILYGHSTKGHKRTEIDAAIIVGSLLGLALVVLLVSYLCRSKETKPIPPGFEYHAFIIFSCEDKNWVTSILLPFLEEKHRLKCCIHYRDFIPGIPFRENMANAVYKSYKTIAVFSHNFLGSVFSMDELDMAVYRLLEKRDRSVVVVRIDDAALRELPRALCKRSVIDYSSSLEIHFWKSKLLEFLAVQDDSSSPSTSSGTDSTIRNTMVELNNNNRSRSSSTGSRSVVTLGEGGSVEVLV